MKLAEQICYAKEQDSPYIGTAEDICQEDRPVSEDGLRVSEEEYWEKYYNHPDFAYEWNNGILEEKPMADYLSSETYRWFVLLLEEYLKANPVAKPVYLDIGFRLALPGKTSIRKPDLALILHSNPVGIHSGDSVYDGIFDLCVEFLSDSKQSEADRDTIVKKAEYRQAGVREYFILDRNGYETAFYRLTGKRKYSHIPRLGGIIRSEVLPGFQFRVRDLYSHPDLRERISDRVYKSFILLDYQKEKKTSEAERKRAEAESKRAEAESKKAEAESKRRAEAEHRAKAESKRRAEAEHRAKAESKKAEAESKRRAEAEHRAKAESKRRAEAEHRAKAESKKAEAEHKRRAEAEHKAEELAAKLRSLGIDPEPV